MVHMQAIWIRDPLAILAEGAERGIVIRDGRIVELVPAGGQPAPNLASTVGGLASLREPCGEVLEGELGKSGPLRGRCARELHDRIRYGHQPRNTPDRALPGVAMGKPGPLT